MAEQYDKDERGCDDKFRGFIFIRADFGGRGMFERKKVVVLSSIFHLYLPYGNPFCPSGESLCLSLLQKGKGKYYLFLLLHIEFNWEIDYHLNILRNE